MKQFLLIIAVLFSTATRAQSDTTSVNIHTNAVCDMCKKTLETDLLYEKGVKAVHLDLAANIIHVNYDAKRTDPAKLRTAVSKLGYMADDVQPDLKARKDLPVCCQKEGCGLPAEKH